MDLFEYSHVKEVSDHLMVKFPYFAKTIEKRMDDFGEPWLADFDEELKIFFGDDLPRLRKAVYGYGTFALDAMKLQKKFDKMHEYIPKSYADVSKEVYHNRDYMCNLYLPGILLSQFLWPHHYRQLLFFRNQFLPRLRGCPNEVFCDVGVGTGFYSKEVLCAMPAIRGRGYDISEFSLEHTKMMIEKWRYQDRYQFYRTNILVDPPGEVADALVCVEVLEHLEDPVTFLKGLYAIIRPGGFGYITAAINAPNADHIYLYRGLKDIEQEIALAGFEILESAEYLGYEPKPGESVPSGGCCIIRKGGRA